MYFLSAFFPSNVENKPKSVSYIKEPTSFTIGIKQEDIYSRANRIFYKTNFQYQINNININNNIVISNNSKTNFIFFINVPRVKLISNIFKNQFNFDSFIDDFGLKKSNWNKLNWVFNFDLKNTANTFSNIKKINTNLSIYGIQINNSKVISELDNLKINSQFYDLLLIRIITNILKNKINISSKEINIFSNNYSNIDKNEINVKSLLLAGLSSTNVILLKHGRGYYFVNSNFVYPYQKHDYVINPKEIIVIRNYVRHTKNFDLIELEKELDLQKTTKNFDLIELEKELEVY